MRGQYMKPRGGRRAGKSRQSRAQTLLALVNEISVNSERYNFWWAGHLDRDPEKSEALFKPAKWGAIHSSTSNYALFTAVFLEDLSDVLCQPTQCFKLFLSTLRVAYEGDVVMGNEVKLFIHFF